MGFIKRKIVETAAKAAAKAVVKTTAVGTVAANRMMADKFGDTNESAGVGFISYQEKMLSQSSFPNHLWMKEKHDYFSNYGYESTYLFFDMQGRQRYSAKGGNERSLQHIKLYDEDGNKIGELSEKLFALRNPILKEEHPVDFELIINGKSIGKLKSAFGFLKDKLVLDYNHWTLQRKAIGKYHVFDNTNIEIAVFSSKVFQINRVTFLEYGNKNDEVVILLLAMALSAQDQSDSRKRRREH